MNAAELTFEQALEEFDRRLHALEDGKLSLEEALKAAQEASAFLRVCESRLEAARKRIEVRPEPPETGLSQATPETAVTEPKPGNSEREGLLF